MALVFENPLNVNLANVRNIQAQGSGLSGATIPNGIAGRVEIVDGMLRTHMKQTDAETFGGIRSEIALNFAALNDEEWLIFEMMVKRAEWGDAEHISVFQVHSDDANPNISINMIAVLRNGMLRIDGPAVEPPTESTAGEVKTYAPFPFDQWNQIAIHAKWANNKTGVLEVFMNRKPIWKQWVKGTAYNADTPYLKLGSYDTQHLAAFGERTAYYRNLYIYHGKESYTTVLGGRPRSAAKVAPTVPPGGLPPTTAPVWRGMGTGMRVIEGVNTGANRSGVHRFPFYSPVPFQRYRVVYPVFMVNYPTAGALTDQLFTGNMSVARYQCGFEYPFVAAGTGIPPRQKVKFGGLDYGDYNQGTWDPATGLMVSDIMDAGQVIPAKTAFGIWTGIEMAAGLGTWALPWSHNYTNNVIQRYIGQLFSTGPVTVAGGNATDVAHAASSITLVNSPTTGLTPCALLVEVPGTTECVMIFGDSKAKGIGDGGAGSTFDAVRYGDVFGDDWGNKGHIDRAIWNNHPGWLFANVAFGGDGCKYHVSNNNHLKYRLELAELCNPTRYIDQYAHNEMSTTTFMTNYSNSLAVYRGQAIATSWGYYVCSKEGTTAASGVGPAHTGKGIVDGTAEFDWLSGAVISDNNRIMANIGPKIEVNRKIRERCPGVKGYGLLAEPGANLTANGGANPDTEQTNVTGFGNPIQRRGLFNQWVRANYRDHLQWLGLFDTNPLMEHNWPVETAKWAHAGVPNKLSTDSAHQNSYGYHLASTLVVLPPDVD